MQVVVQELLSEAASQRWIDEQLRSTGLKTMDFRNGAAMELEPARDLAASLVAAARGLLGDAPNYVENVYDVGADPDKASYSMTVSIPELPERYTLTVQRIAPGKLTPHEARMRAEKAIEGVWRWIADANDGYGSDRGDLAQVLEGAGFPPSVEES